MTDRLNDVAADLRGFASSRLQQWIAVGTDTPSAQSGRLDS